MRHRGQTPAPGSPFALLFGRIDAHLAKTKKGETGGPPVAEPSWEDAADEWTAAIQAAFPTRSESHDEYGVAMQMVGHRHSKGELVALVNWLLVEKTKTERTLTEYRERDERLARGIAELQRVHDGDAVCPACGEQRKHLWHECRSGGSET